MFLVFGTACSASDDFDPDDLPRISEDLDAAPTVSQFSDSEPPGTAGSAVIVRGNGDEIADTDLIAVDQVMYEWAGPQMSSTYESGDPLFLSLPEAAERLPLVSEALVDQPVGSRIAVALTPDSVPTEAGGAEAPEDDAAPPALLVYDIRARYPAYASVDSRSGEAHHDGGEDGPSVTVSDGRQPQITVPRTAPPGELDVATLIEGNGEEIVAGSTIVTQFRGVAWSTGNEFDSTWEYGGVPADFQMSPDSVIAGWLDGLTGVRAGSRVLLTVPPEFGYGDGGNTTVDVAPDETLIYVIDILDLYGTG